MIISITKNPIKKEEYVILALFKIKIKARLIIKKITKSFNILTDIGVINAVAEVVINWLEVNSAISSKKVKIGVINKISKIILFMTTGVILYIFK